MAEWSHLSWHATLNCWWGLLFRVTVGWGSLPSSSAFLQTTTTTTGRINGHSTVPCRSLTSLFGLLCFDRHLVKHSFSLALELRIWVSNCDTATHSLVGLEADRQYTVQSSCSPPIEQRVLDRRQRRHQPHPRNARSQLRSALTTRTRSIVAPCIFSTNAAPARARLTFAQHPPLEPEHR